MMPKQVHTYLKLHVSLELSVPCRTMLVIYEWLGKATKLHGIAGPKKNMYKWRLIINSKSSLGLFITWISH